MPRLDATDWAILDVLQDDARTSNRDLAAAVHVSPSTASERVRSLKADAVIRGYHADVAYGALGRHVQALTAITIRPPTREIIEAFRMRYNAIVELADTVEENEYFLVNRELRSIELTSADMAFVNGE